jgi:hypothetical protein
MIPELNSIDQYPTQIVKTVNAASDTDSPASLHKALLDLGESLLVYITGILFGEYKRSGEVSEKVEAEFYKYSSRKPSFGVFLSFMRILSKAQTPSILSSRFDKSMEYSRVSEFVLMFEMLKNIVNEGHESGLEILVNQAKKGRTMPKKGVIDFFNSFVMIRNIYAHPEDKAGPKNNKRKWPLSEEYFSFINLFMQSALNEIIAGFHIFEKYRPVLAKSLDDRNKKGDFLVEVGDDESQLTLDLTPEDLHFINTNLRYILGPDNQPYIKLYYNMIPQLNPSIAQKIINAEKAKAMEPVIVDMINAKLEDKQIDKMELLVLKDTAKASFITEERLFQLIEKAKSKLEIQGDIFVEGKEASLKPFFNIWWLNYLNMLPKIPQATIKSELAESSKIKGRIKELKEKRKKVNAKVKGREQKLRKLKKSERKYKKSGSKMLEKTTEKISDLTSELEELKLAQGEKLQEFDTQIKDLEVRSTVSQVYRQFGIHKSMWDEINFYVEHLLDENLNSRRAFSGEDDGQTEDDTPEREWINEPNKWQIGALSYTYWARIYPAMCPLGSDFNVGLAVSRAFKWLGTVRHPEVNKKVNLPCVIIWPTWDRVMLARIDDGKLFSKYLELMREMLRDYEEELINLGTHVGCYNRTEDSWDEIPVAEYARNRENYLIEGPMFDTPDPSEDGFRIHSRIWNVIDFMENGELSFDKIARFEKEMITYIQIFSNLVVKINDYALEIGVNKETIEDRLDHMNRVKDELWVEFDKFHEEGTLFYPTGQDDKDLFVFAGELGVNRYLFNYLKNQYRFSKKWEEKRKRG